MIPWNNPPGNVGSFPANIGTWAMEQNALVLPNYPQNGYPPILHSQTDYPPQFHQQNASQYQTARVAQMTAPPTQNIGVTINPNTAQMSTSATWKPEAYLNTISPAVTPYPRTRRESIQLTVALHLYLEAIPGPLLDDLTISQIVHHQVAGAEWSPPEDTLLTNMNANPSYEIRALYHEVIRSPQIWVPRAGRAYMAWARLCIYNGVRPQMARVARMW